ncbi:MAG: hypothetical protein PHQ33_07400 [Bacteroidales bacterium]|nr:hypothetical protein [Bacteroidales bacterium]
MSKERECAESIRGIVGKTAFSTYLCRVKCVEGATCTVVREMDEMEIKEVRINATITENQGLVIAPKVNSYVLITDIDGDKWFVSQFSEIDKITIDCENDIVINGGNNAGMVKISELTQKLNALVNSYNSHTHTIPDGSSGTTSHIASTFNKSDYENTKITH